MTDELSVNFTGAYDITRTRLSERKISRHYYPNANARLFALQRIANGIPGLLSRVADLIGRLAKPVRGARNGVVPRDLELVLLRQEPCRYSQGNHDDQRDQPARAAATLLLGDDGVGVWVLPYGVRVSVMCSSDTSLSGLTSIAA